MTSIRTFGEVVQEFPSRYKELALCVSDLKEFLGKYSDRTIPTLALYDAWSFGRNIYDEHIKKRADFRRENTEVSKIVFPEPRLVVVSQETDDYIWEHAIIPLAKAGTLSFDEEFFPAACNGVFEIRFARKRHGNPQEFERLLEILKGIDIFSACSESM